MKNNQEIFLWQQIYATLFAVSNKLQILGDQALGNLTSRQLMTLIAIIHLPKDSASLNQIAKKLGTTKQNTKQLVSVLEKKGYVKLVPSIRDKRAYNVTITTSGEEATLEGQKLGTDFFQNVFAAFSIEKLEVFWNMLKTLYRFDGEEQFGFEEIADLNKR